MYFLYLLHLFYISTQSIFGTGEAISDESILRFSMAKRLSLDVKFPFCQAPPGSDYREKWLSSFIFLGGCISRGPGAAVVTEAMSQNLSHLVWGWVRLCLMIPECFIGLSRRSN